MAHSILGAASQHTDLSISDLVCLNQRDSCIATAVHESFFMIGTASRCTDFFICPAPAKFNVH